MEESQPQPDRIRLGGLMRCCTETVADLYPDGLRQVGTEGQTLACQYHPDNRNHRMRFRDGAWEWDREAAGLTDTTDA